MTTARPSRTDQHATSPRTQATAIVDGRVRAERDPDDGDDVHPRVPARVRALLQRRPSASSAIIITRRQDPGCRQRPGHRQHHRHDPHALGQAAAVHPVLRRARSPSSPACCSRFPNADRDRPARLLRHRLRPLGHRLHGLRRAALGAHRLGVRRPDPAQPGRRQRPRVRLDLARPRHARDAATSRRALQLRDRSHRGAAGRAPSSSSPSSAWRSTCSRSSSAASGDHDREDAADLPPAVRRPVPQQAAAAGALGSILGFGRNIVQTGGATLVVVSPTDSAD